MKNTNDTNKQIPIQWLYHASIVPSTLNPRTEIKKEALDELRASFKERGFDPHLSQLLVRPIKQNIRIECEDALAELQGKGKPFRVERESGAGVWEVVSRWDTEAEATDAAVRAMRFEIVIGERRWTVAGEEKMEMVPAVVKEMTDGEALETMLIENGQRDDLTPMQEANGYQNLLSMLDAEGQPIYTHKLIADRIGRTIMHVKRRLALVRLKSTEAGEALETGLLPVRCADLIASLPTPELRAEVTEKVLRNPYGPSPMPRTQLEQMLRDDYQRDLRGASFSKKDETLVLVRVNEAGERVAGGACEDCPLRELQHGGRFAMCQNPGCYREKEAADYERWRVTVTDEAADRRALPAAENAALWDDVTGKHLGHSTPYVDLGTKPAPHLLRPGVESNLTWKKILAGHALAVTVARDKDGIAHDLVNREAALTAALASASGKLFKNEGSQANPKTGPAETSPADRAVNAEKRAEQTKANEAAYEKAKRERAREETIAGAEMGKVREALRGLKTLPDAAWPLAVEPLIFNLADIEESDAFAKAHGWEAKKTGPGAEVKSADFIRKYFKNLPDPHRFGFLIELCIATAPEIDARKTWAKALGVDLKPVRKAMEDAFSKEDKAESERAEIAQGMVWGSQKAKAEEFVWNSASVCENPDVCRLTLPKVKGSQVAASLSVARSAKGWHYGVDVVVRNSGHAFSPSQNTPGYSTRNLAVATALMDILRDAAFEAKYEPAAHGRLQAYLASVQGTVPVHQVNLPGIGKSKPAPAAKGAEKKAAVKPKTQAPVLADEIEEAIIRALKKAGTKGATPKEIGFSIGKTAGTVTGWLMTRGRNDYRVQMTLAGKWSLPASGKAPAVKSTAKK